MTGNEEELPVHDARNMDGEEKNYRIIEDGDMAITTFCLSGKRREPEVPHLPPGSFTVSSSPKRPKPETNDYSALQTDGE